MKKTLYIFLAAVALLAACHPVEPEERVKFTEDAPSKVTISFPISIPTDGAATKTMANKPDIKNIYVAVFGGNGYFNEWVPAEYKADDSATQYAIENETVYRLKVKLTTSASRLSLHIIANCPLSDPPITGVSSDDVETVVMSKVRSQINSENNDAYWQKIVLPYGVRDSVYVTNGTEQPFLDANGNRVPTRLTESQFERWSPIPLVRNFARVRVQLTATNVEMDKIALAFAPAEGPVAPILPNTYPSDAWGNPVNVSHGPDYQDEQGNWHDGAATITDGSGNTLSTFWNEAFFMGYESKTLEQLAAAPYNYSGYSPANQKFGTYPASESEMTPWSDDTWRDDYLYLYERPKPRSGERATRILIHAKNGSEPWKYYALDIVDSNKEPMPLLRNYTYNLVITGLDAGTGEETIAKAAVSTGADVSADVRTTDLGEVSDGKSLIAVSYVDTTAIKAGNYYVMYRFVPDVDSEEQVNNPSTSTNKVGVSLQFGYNNGTDGFVEGADSANGNAFASDPAIELNGDGTAKLYVRSGNGWAAATAAQIADASIEKWSRINYTTVTKDKAGSDAVDAQGYYTKGFTKTIRVTGTKANGGKLYRDVQVNLIQRKTMRVECLDKFIEEEVGAAETVRIFIPNDITRSMFPMEFKIQAAANSLTPRDGDNLPVSSGKSIVPGETTRSAFFFIKTLTRDEYNAAKDTTIGGVQMKYFDCKFKSSKASSASAVYAYNEYFNTGSDSFDNYVLRKFTGTGPGTLSMGQETTFKFYMDAAHNGSPIWNDGTVTSTNTKVLPKIVTIKMTGIQPATNSDGSYIDMEDGLVKGDGTGVYWYLVYSEVNPTDYRNEITLHLEAGNADSYSIELSTSRITPNPGLYENYTVSGTITKSQITGSGFTNTSGGKITSVKKEAGLPVQFRFTYGGDLVPVSFKLQGLSTTDSRVSGPDAGGVYTFTPTGTAKAQVINFTTTDANTQCRLYDFAVTDDSYNQPSPNNFSLKRVNGHYSISLEPGNTAYGWTSSTVNPDSDQYYAYQSTNNGVNSSIATMSVTIVGYEEFTVYIRSYAESSYDYVVVRNLDADPLTSWSNTYNGTKATTQSNQQPDNAISNYTAVTFTTADGLTGDDTPHTFYIQYGKDNGWAYGDDRGYVLIPKEYTRQVVAVTGVALDQTAANVSRGGTLQLTATVSPTNAEDKTVSWSSSDPSVATVSDSGLVTIANGAAVGSTATITVTTNDGEYAASCVITVTRRKVTGTATFTSSDFTSGTNKTATKTPIKLDISRVSGSYNSYIEVNKGLSSTLTFTPISTASMVDVTISGITLSFYNGNNRYNPNNISGSFTGGTGTNMTATYNGGDTTSPVTTTLTARTNREFDMQITVEYYYYE